MYDIILFGDMPDIQSYARATGAHRLATELREQGYSVLVVDFSTYVNLERFKKIIDLALGENTLFVGFSTQWYPYRWNGNYFTSEPSKTHNKYDGNVVEDSVPLYFGKCQTQPMFDYIKSKNKKTKIVLGGFKVFMYLDTPGVDNCFIGYSDTMIIDYANSLSGKGSKRIFNKIIDYDKKAQNPEWDFRKSKISFEPESFILPTETLTLEIGRGCRFKCGFCSFPLIGQKNINDYLKFEDCLYNELIDNYNKWGVHKYMIVDDTFNDSTEKLEMVLRVVKRLPFKPIFWCYLRADLLAVHSEQIKILKDIGIRSVYFGIETLNKKAGQSIGKGMNPVRIIDTLEQCANEWGRDVWIMAGLICGLPNDTIEDFENTCEQFDRSDSPVNQFNVTPLRILKHDDFTKYRFNAPFETNSEKYGYTWPTEIPWYWEKNDTDIKNYEIACELAIKWQKKIDQHFKINRFYFYESCLLDKRFDFDTLMSLETREDYQSHVGDVNKVAAMKDQIEAEYFLPLFRFLEARKSH